MHPGLVLVPWLRVENEVSPDLTCLLLVLQRASMLDHASELWLVVLSADGETLHKRLPGSHPTSVAVRSDLALQVQGQMPGTT